MRILKVFDNYEKLKFVFDHDSKCLSLSIENVKQVGKTIQLVSGVVIQYIVINNDYTLNKIRGLKIDCFFIDECKTLTEKEFFAINERVKRGS